MRRTYVVRLHIDLRTLLPRPVTEASTKAPIPSIAMLFPNRKKGTKVFYAQLGFENDKGLLG